MTKFFPELEAHLRGIYGDRNRRHEQTSRHLFMVTRVGITAARIAKCVRNGNPDGAKGLLAMLVAWFVGYRKVGAEPLGSLVYRHYPRICPYRCQAAPCQCNGNKGKRKPALSGQVTEMSIDELQSMFGSIYPNCTPAYSSDKIIEEVAEWADQLMVYLIGGGDVRLVEMELSDVLAHCFGLANALGISLCELLWQTFKDGCPKCKGTPCVICPSFAEITADSVPVAS